MKAEFEQKVDDIFEDLTLGHNFDYAGKAIKELAAEFHTKEVEQVSLTPTQTERAFTNARMLVPDFPVLLLLTQKINEQFTPPAQQEKE